ncbi:MAG: hypothetical protein WCW52_05855 [Elusimicrobiales bacterium]
MDWENIAAELKSLTFKLDSVCRKFWDEDRSAAVPLEAVAGEIKIAVGRAEQVMAELGRVAQLCESSTRALDSEMRKEKVRADTLQEELKAAMSRIEKISAEAAADHEAAARAGAMAARLEQELKLGKEGAAALQEELKAGKAYTEKILREAAGLKEEIVALKDEHLKAEARKDAERAKKMEDLISSLSEKKRELEAAWARRHSALEAEQKESRTGFEKMHKALLEEMRVNAAGAEKAYSQKEAKLIEFNRRLIEEFQDREGKVRALEEDLRAKAFTLDEASAELGREFERKRAELEGLKNKILAEISELVKPA